MQVLQENKLDKVVNYTESLPYETPQEEFKYHIKQTKNGNIFSFLNVAYCYQYGYGVKEDFQNCLKYYKMAEKKGDTEAQYQLGLIYLKGDKVKKDLNMASDLILKAALTGHMKAMNIVEKNRKDKRDDRYVSCHEYGDKELVDSWDDRKEVEL